MDRICIPRGAVDFGDMPWCNVQLVVKGTLTRTLVSGDAGAVANPQSATRTRAPLDIDITVLWRSWDITTVITGARGIAIHSSTFSHCNMRKVFTHLIWLHDDVIKWKQFPRYWPFVWGIHRSPVNSPHKDQWRGALVFSLICARINGSVNNCEAGDWDATPLIVTSS